MAEEKEYDVLLDGTEMAAALIERYSDSFVGIDPASVIVMAISNKKPPKSKRRPIALCRRLDPVTKSLLKHFNCPNVKYFIEFYGSDWLELSDQRRQAVMFHELMHIPTPGVDSLVPHDTEDFSPLIELWGCNWLDNPNLPNLLQGDKVIFNTGKIVELRQNA
jgi:predicted metallopeptidase